MPGDVSQRRLSREEQLGVAIGTCSVVRDDLRSAIYELSELRVHVEQGETDRQVLNGHVLTLLACIARNFGRLDLLARDIGPFLSSKEVTAKNGSATGVNA